MKLGSLTGEVADLAAPAENEELIELEEVDIYLARANLLRMRGEHEQAKEICRAILKAVPHQALTHAMLGDIALELNDLDQATHWFEFACEYDPGYQPFVQKLVQARQRKSEHEAAEAARKLGYGASGWSIPSLLAVITMVLLALAIGAFALGRNQNSQAVKPPTITEPAVITGKPVRIKAEEPTAQPALNEVAKVIRTPEETLILKAIEEKLRWNTKLLNLTYDTFSGTAVINFAGDTEEGAQESADKLVADAKSALPDVNIISLRYFVAGKLIVSAHSGAVAVPTPEPSSDQKVNEPNNSATEEPDSLKPSEGPN